MNDQKKHRNPRFENINEDPEFEVKKVLSQIQWDGMLPIDLIQICEMYGFNFEFKPDPDMKEQGTTKFYGDGDFCIIINTHNSDCLNGFSSEPTLRRRQRFTLAHEIGHCIYPSHQNIKLQQNLSNPANPYAKDYTKQRENQANLFAAHLLVPRVAFNKFAQQFWGNIETLIQTIVDNFDVSYQVAIQQTAILADVPCIAILFHKNGMPQRTPTYSPDFSETKLFYGKNQNVPDGTLAALMLSGKNNTKQASKRYPDASTWFPESGRKAEKFLVSETSFNFGKYGVASFLELMNLDD